MSTGSAVQALRTATAADHDRVDALFANHDLADRDAYRIALTAHARALPAVEQVLTGRAELPVWRPRADLLRADLADLGAGWPEPMPFAAPADAAEAWGMLYVIEGSRLGGAMLARTIGPGLPGRYLGARHLPGEWRSTLAALEAAADGPEWLARAIAGAQATFDLYARAVDTDGQSRAEGPAPG